MDGQVQTGSCVQEQRWPNPRQGGPIPIQHPRKQVHEVPAVQPVSSFLSPTMLQTSERGPSTLPGVMA